MMPGIALGPVRVRARQRLNDQREAVSEVIARSAVLARNDTEAVMLDLVQPLATRGHFCRKARRENPARWSTCGVWESVAAALAETMAESAHYDIDSTTVRAPYPARGKERRSGVSSDLWFSKNSIQSGA
jgi:hypothetical protein